MIKQAPVSFVLVYGLGLIVIYLALRRSFQGRINEFRDWLADRERVIAFLEKRQGSSPGSTDNSAEGKAFLPPVIQLTDFDFEDVAKDTYGFYSRASSNLLFKLAILDFSLKPISGAVPWTEAQPRIRFKDPQGHITRVSDAIWLGETVPKVPFRYGVTRSLGLASRSSKRDFRTYERDTQGQVLERQLDGDVLRVEVRLVAEYLDDPKASETWYFKLMKGDTPAIIKSTQEEFER